MNQTILNPWAPGFLNGYNAMSPDDCEDVEGAYVWPETNGFHILTANEERSEALILDNEDDFRFMLFQWALQSVDEQSTPGFLYRIRGSDGKYLCDGFTYCFSTPGTFANPWPQFPHETYTFHQRIEFEVINVASHSQGVQLMFRGSKRFRRRK